MPRLTVGMPVYNGADYLEGALASLAAQDLGDMEIIISDNASTDETPAIIAKWAARDPRIRAHRQPGNIGAPRNFEWVLQQAKSPLMMFAAHDDEWAPDYASTLCAALEKAPGCVLAVPGVVGLHPDGTRMGGAFAPDPRIARARGDARLKLTLHSMRSAWMYGVARHEAFLSAWRGVRRFEYVWGSDNLLLLGLFLAGPVVPVPETTFYQRHTGVSQARYPLRTFAEQARFLFRFWQETGRLLEEAGFSPARRLALLPDRLRFCNRHGFKFRRLLRNGLKSLLAREGL